MKAFVCNTGIISAIGNNTPENLDALKTARHGISLPEILPTRHSLPVGEIKYSNQELSEIYGIPGEWPRTAKLSCIAAAEAWQPFKERSEGLRIALLTANTVGGMDLSEAVFGAFSEDPGFSGFNAFRYHECGVTGELTARYLGLDCFVSTLSTACSSSANTIMLGSRLIANDRFDVVIAGGADALSKFTVNGFNALMILDKEHCRPYDTERKGLNIGEGAAYLVLANQKAADQWQIRPTCFVSGYANANDAHHQTATSPEGTGNRLAMQGALQQAGLMTGDIHYINLHGTGTVNNDASEGKAVADIFTTGVPPAGTTKVFTGHTLGAAGAIEAVYACLSIQEQAAWPQINLVHPESGNGWTPNTTLLRTPIRHVMSNSFGFGGNCSSLIFSKA